MTNETELKSALGATPAVDLADLTARIGRAAGAEGTLDLAYCEIDSPVGSLLGVVSPTGLIKLGYPNREVDEQLEWLAATVSPRILESPTAFGLDEVRRELDQYFEGERRSFDLPIDWSLTKGFVNDVLRQTARIPFGETRSYGEMATSAGSPRAFRAAGSALGANPIPIVVPCHRVLRSGGALGGYGGGLDVKIKLLELEGVLT